MDLASVLLLTVRGIPIIYYGDEQYLAVYDAPVDYQPQYINSGSDDPWNRPGMKNWDEATPAFRIISALACLRKNDPAVWRGTYNTLYSDADVLIYERVAGNDSVLVAVNRGPAKDIALQGSLGFVPGTYRGLIADASSANAGNYVRIGRQASLAHLGAISALALRN
jgi:glycosidase